MPKWQPLNGHRYYCESDLLFIEVHGDFVLPDVLVLYSVLEPILNEYGYLLLAFDGRDSGTVTAPARKYIGERSRGYRAEGGTVIIGASFMIRTLVQLVRNASRLVGMRSAPMLFCATTEEALQWLGKQRQRCQAAHRV